MTRSLFEIMIELTELVADPASGVDWPTVVEALPEDLREHFIEEYRRSAQVTLMNDPGAIGATSGELLYSPERKIAALDSLTRSVQQSLDDITVHTAAGNETELMAAIQRLHWSFFALKGLVWHMSRSHNGIWREFPIPDELEELTISLLPKARDTLNAHRQYLKGNTRRHKASIADTDELVKEFKAWFDKIRALEAASDALQ